MRGYWEKPERDRRSACGPARCPARWCCTPGDLFRTDDEGYLYFVARKDDIIKSRGEKVSPREVENAHLQPRGRARGRRDRRARRGAWARPSRRSSCSRKAARSPSGTSSSTASRSLESFMVPKHVEFVDELPKTDTGKIAKRASR